MILWLLACKTEAPPKVEAPSCPDARRVEGRVTGAVVGQPDLRVAALDASSWRFDDAADLSDVVTPEASGAFTLCLDETAPRPDVYAKAVVAAWRDLDGDDRYDVRSEALCDAGAAGWTMEYLFYGDTADGTGWTVGVDRRGFGDLSVVSPILDGDTCRR